MPRCRILFIVQFFAMSMMIFGCGVKVPQHRIWYELDPSTPSPQVKGNIQVTVHYIGNDSSQAFRDIVSRRVSKAPTYGVLVQTLAGTQKQYLTGFDVKIQNNTNHILRLNDSRIYLVVGEDAIRCMTKSELLAWHSSPDVMQSRPNMIPVNMIY